MKPADRVQSTARVSQGDKEPQEVPKVLMKKIVDFKQSIENTHIGMLPGANWQKPGV